MLCNRHSLDLRVFFPLMLETWNCAWNSNTKKVCWCMYCGDNYIIQCDTFKFYILYLHEFFFVIFYVTLQVRWFILKMVSIELSGPPSYLCLWDSQTRELQCPSWGAPSLTNLGAGVSSDIIPRIVLLSRAAGPSFYSPAAAFQGVPKSQKNLKLKIVTDFHFCDLYF